MHGNDDDFLQINQLMLFLILATMASILLCNDDVARCGKSASFDRWVDPTRVRGSRRQLTSKGRDKVHGCDFQLYLMTS